MKMCLFLFSKMLFLGLVLGLIGCSSRPTQIYEIREAQVDSRWLVQGLKDPLEIGSTTVVVDSRSHFDYSMAHIPGSVHLQWQDFTQPQGVSPGQLKGDLYRETRRLARKGINPKSKVIVVGNGLSGRGESGRLAWTLYYLGVRDIQFVHVNYFKTRLSNASEPQKQKLPVTMWKPQLKERALASLGEIKAAATYRAKVKTVILDVRSHQEYFNKKGFGLKYSLPDLNAINIEWKEFFDSNGRPSLKMKRKLSEIGIQSKDRVLVISQQGVRSGAVTMALLSLGFVNTANSAEGYKGLIRSGSSWQQ